MKDFVIIADCSCDLNEEFRSKYKIECIAGHVISANGKDIKALPEWKEIKGEDFYKELKKNPSAYSTSPASVGEFYENFKKYAKDGKDILCLTISTGISGTYGFAEKAKEMILKEYPDCKVICIDSLRFSAGLGLMAIYASNLRKDGKSVLEVAEWIENNKNRFHQMGWLDDLSFCAKKGRLTNAKAFFGTLVGIKPLGEFDYNGLTTVIGKVKGEKKAYSVILDYIEKTGEDLKNQTVLIAQTDRLSQAEKFKQMIIERFGVKEIYIIDVYAFNGINVGPGLMACYYTGKPISKELTEERKIISEIISKE